MPTCRHDSLGRQIYQTSQAMRTHIERLLKPFEITSEQLLILKSVAEADGRTQSELCRLVGKTPANITRILDRLEKKALIVRRENPHDRRSSLIYQTSAGADLSGAVARVFETMSAEIERGIRPEDIAGCRNALSRINANLSRLSNYDGD